MHEETSSFVFRLDSYQHPSAASILRASFTASPNYSAATTGSSWASTHSCRRDLKSVRRTSRSCSKNLFASHSHSRSHHRQPQPHPCKFPPSEPPPASPRPPKQQRPSPPNPEPRSRPPRLPSTRPSPMSLRSSSGSKMTRKTPTKRSWTSCTRTSKSSVPSKMSWIRSVASQCIICSVYLSY